MTSGRLRFSRAPGSRVAWALVPVLVLVPAGLSGPGAAHGQQIGAAAPPCLQIFAVAASDNSLEVCFRAEFPPGEGGVLRAAGLAQELRDAGWETEVVPRGEFTALNAVGHSVGGQATGSAVLFPAAVSEPGSALQWHVQDRVVYSIREFQVSYAPSGHLLEALSGRVDGTPPAEVLSSLVCTLTSEFPGYVLGTDAQARAGRGLYWEFCWTPGSVLTAGARTVAVDTPRAAVIAGGTLLSALLLLFLADEVRRSRRAKHAPRRRRPETAARGQD